MHTSLRFFTGLLLFLNCAFERAQAVNYFLQLGANQGALAGGILFPLERFQIGVSLGLTPSNVGENIITQLNTKANFKLLSAEEFQWYLGGSLFINASKATFFELPPKYPKGYYPPNAYFFAYQNTFYWRNYFIEISLLDYFIEVLARNPYGTVSPFEVWSLGVGIEF